MHEGTSNYNASLLKAKLGGTVAAQLLPTWLEPFSFLAMTFAYMKKKK